MIPFFRDLFDYHHQTNQRLADQLIEHEVRLTDRSIPLFSHMINAHQIWNARILDLVPLGVFQVHSLKDCKALDGENFDKSLQILDSFDLSQPCFYTNSKGQTFENSIRDILFHATNHMTHHRGQLISDLRQNGMTSIVTDYIFYKR
ncbi:damage-inducible protein DinB [Reichenbachiella carrageenanivorans]|uniref:Damage-inducible protein DinB n=1 Tax=Reichenbachiella carrageenanivorans TaxID=2979869 RepID=A0ABY6D2H7_9BACT|nr:DinB family protein [Reichenbachiella carrageenanivorans]UXX80367.1 damage-inducible protein DinB [Reichenbachiella carrageenanivorans]